MRRYIKTYETFLSEWHPLDDITPPSKGGRAKSSLEAALAAVFLWNGFRRNEENGEWMFGGQDAVVRWMPVNITNPVVVEYQSIVNDGAPMPQSIKTTEQLQKAIDDQLGDDPKRPKNSTTLK